MKRRFLFCRYNFRLAKKRLCFLMQNSLGQLSRNEKLNSIIAGKERRISELKSTRFSKMDLHSIRFRVTITLFQTRFNITFPARPEKTLRKKLHFYGEKTTQIGVNTYLRFPTNFQPL